ncbi:MAG: hypothetical protein EOP22_12775 [Hyphomicrobiales bacterium]|nr:MAG: hypothetical protein EOP22_12775 [Hyphomicrobiales bacterium]
MTEPQRHRLGDGLALLIGLGIFFIYCGWWVLIPTNIAWLDAGDRAMHQIGWMYFQSWPWSWPLSLNPGLGIEVATSIALVDGLPLLAFPFKLIAPWLPQPFQYWGWWLLVSFALQGLFGYRLAREFGASLLVALAAAAFVLITPAFLYRVPMHLALSSHWVILAALYLNVRRKPAALWAWPLLATITTSIHVTLLAMVLGLWVASLAQRWMQGVSSRRARSIETMLVFIGVAAVIRFVGLLATGSLGSSGYGSYKLNLAWPFIDYGWSRLMPDIAHTRFDYEGLSFLGIGIMALLLLGLVTGGALRLGELSSKRWWPLLAMLLLLMLFAFSRSISFTDIDLLNIAMPFPVSAIGAAFRSTGRFIWPLLYLLTILAVVLAGRHLPRALALPVIVLALGAQIYDSAPAWRRFAERMPDPSTAWSSPLRSPFWERAADAGYNRVRTIPTQYGYGSDWKDIGYYAVTHGMATDTVLLARVDGPKLGALRRQAEESLVSGAFEPRTIYLLDPQSALAAMQHLAPGDLLAIIDGYIVFVRDGAGLIEGLDIENTTRNGGSWVPTVSQGGSLTD